MGHIRRILVPLDSSAYCEAATNRACEVARTHGATLSGLVVLDTVGISASVSPVDIAHWPLVEEAVLAATAEERKRAAAAKEKFAQVCGEKEVTHRETQLDGVPADSILHMSVLYDLVVMGVRTFYTYGAAAGVGDSLAKVLDRSSTPILAVPLGDPKPFDQVAIAYDGSFSSGRALRDFAAFAAPYHPTIKVVTANEDERQARMLLDEAVTYLEMQGLSRPDTVHLRAKNLVGEELEDADLVVAGIHSRKFFRDLVVGNLVKQLIEEEKVALFLSH